MNKMNLGDKISKIVKNNLSKGQYTALTTRGLNPGIQLGMMALASPIPGPAFVVPLAVQATRTPYLKKAVYNRMVKAGEIKGHEVPLSEKWEEILSKIEARSPGIKFSKPLYPERSKIKDSIYESYLSQDEKDKLANYSYTLTSIMPAHKYKNLTKALYNRKIENNEISGKPVKVTDRYNKMLDDIIEGDYSDMTNDYFDGYYEFAEELNDTDIKKKTRLKKITALAALGLLGAGARYLYKNYKDKQKIAEMYRILNT